MNNFSMSHFLNCKEGPELITDSQWNKTSCSLLSTFVIVAPQCPRLPGILSLETYNPVHWTLATAVGDQFVLRDFPQSVLAGRAQCLRWLGESRSVGHWPGKQAVMLCCTLRLQHCRDIMSYYPIITQPEKCWMGEMRDGDNWPARTAGTGRPLLTASTRHTCR